MKNFRLFSFIALSFLVVSVFAQPPVNMSCAKRAVIHYYESGEFDKDVALVLNDAEKYMQKRINENTNSNSPRKLAIVFDIDDTCISNYLNYKKIDFGRSKEFIESSYQNTDAPAIQASLQLYNEAIKNGLAVFFISSRPNTVTNFTVTNLQKAGFYNWTKLYLKDADLEYGEDFKLQIRKQLYAQGYKIILNIGDQDSDFIGGYAEQTYKIPNPLYTISVCN